MTQTSIFLITFVFGVAIIGTILLVVSLIERIRKKRFIPPWTRQLDSQLWQKLESLEKTLGGEYIAKVTLNSGEVFDIVRFPNSWSSRDLLDHCMVWGWVWEKGPKARPIEWRPIDPRLIQRIEPCVFRISNAMVRPVHGKGERWGTYVINVHLKDGTVLREFTTPDAHIIRLPDPYHTRDIQRIESSDA